MTEELNNNFMLEDSRASEIQKKQYIVSLRKKSPPSIYYCNFRSIYEDNYPGKFDDELATMLIKLYTNKGQVVFDPMAGSGIIPLTALKLRTVCNLPGYQSRGTETLSGQGTMFLQSAP